MDAKRSLTRKWIMKARSDLLSAKKLARGKDVYLDTAIYHCQQTTEKVIKGWLVYHDISFEKTHDLRLLVTMALMLNQSSLHGSMLPSRYLHMQQHIDILVNYWNQQKKNIFGLSKRHLNSINLSARCCPLSYPSLNQANIFLNMPLQGFVSSQGLMPFAPAQSPPTCQSGYRARAGQCIRRYSRSPEVIERTCSISLSPYTESAER